MFLMNYAGTDFFTNAAGISLFVFLLLVNCLGLLMRQERLSNGGKWFTWDEVRDFKQATRVFYLILFAVTPNASLRSLSSLDLEVL